jgi:hypothetical protein
MARTTVDIDSPILNEIRRIQREEGLPLGKIISRLLSDALARRKQKKTDRPELRWVSRRMNPLVDLSDKEAVYGALDRDTR